MLEAAGYPHGVTFKLDHPAGDTTFAPGGRPSERAGHRRVQRQHPADPGRDFLTDVYIKKQGDAVLSEDSPTGPTSPTASRPSSSHPASRPTCWAP